MQVYHRIRDLGHQRACDSLEQVLELKRRLEEAVPAELLAVSEPVLASAPLEVMAHLVTLREARGAQGLADVRVALVHVAPDRLAAWYEAALYFSLELFVAVPEAYDAEGSGLHLAFQAGARIFLTHEPRLALDGAMAVLFGEAEGDVPDEDGAPLPRETALARYATADVLLLEDDPCHAALLLRVLAEA